MNITSEPVYRMLSIGNAIKGSGLAETLIIKYRDVVAVDYAYNFLERSLKIGLDALAKDFKLDTRQTDTAKELRDRARGYLTALALEKQAHYSKVQAFNSGRLAPGAAGTATAQQHAPTRHRHAGAERSCDGITLVDTRGSGYVRDLRLRQ